MSRSDAMSRERLAEELAGQGRWCEARSPLYAEVLRGLAKDAERSPSWLGLAESVWRGRPFAVGWEAAHLLLACMHHWALSGRAGELAAVYPSCGGGGGDPAAAAGAFLHRAPPEFWEQLGGAFVQTNEVERSVAWMLAAAEAFGRRRLPFELVELGASAGLSLIGDHLPHSCRFLSEEGEPAEPPPGWDLRPHAAAARTGLDRRPRRLWDPADRLWLKACVWADDLPRLSRLESAISTYLRLEAGADGPRLERCEFSDAPGWLSIHRPPRPGEGLLLFNSIATVYLERDDYAALAQGLAEAMAPWGDRAVWVEYERARDAEEGFLRLSAHRVIGGRLETRVLAFGPPRPSELRLRGGWEFLRG